MITKQLQKKNHGSPMIRFPEFSGEWEEKKISSFLIERNETAPKNDKYPLMAFVAYKGVVPKGERYNREFLVNDSANKKYKKTEYGDFIYSSNNLETGSIGLNRYGSASISPVYSIFKIKESCDYQFMSNFLVRKRFINKMIRYRQGVVYGQWKIRESDFLKIKERIPLLPEQQKIAFFLVSIDKWIDNLKSQRGSLQEYKKGIVQKIFKQEIRFKDDNGKIFPEWKEKKLGDCLDYIQPTEYIVASTEYNDEYKIPVLTAGKSFILGYTNESEGVFKDGLPVIIFDDFTTASQFVDFPFKVKSSAMKILKTKSNINIKFIHEAMKNIVYKVGVHGRHWISKYSNINILVPELSEQNKIANFIYSIDKKIELKERQIAQVEEWKKGLIQGLFI